MKKIWERLSKIHLKLIDDEDGGSELTDTGTIGDGWVVYTVSCKKSDFWSKLETVRKTHKAGYPIRTKEEKEEKR